MILASASWVSLIVSLAAAMAYALPALAAQHLKPRSKRGVMVLAWLLHGLLLAWGLSDEPARFGFAPALSVTVWLVAVVYAIETRVYPQLEIHWALSVLGALVVVLALFYPGQVLHASASALLPLHWALGIASYGLFAAAALHAWLMNRTEDRIRHHAGNPYNGLPLLTLERLTFRFVTAGFVLLSATLLLAIFFKESLYGVDTAWKWDHKTIFSVLSWLTFATLLVGRVRFGWRGRQAARLLYIGSGLLLLAYVGSRFVIEVILSRNA
jgi:ABC-type uncharacterized transport system permease subunit